MEARINYLAAWGKRSRSSSPRRPLPLRRGPRARSDVRGPRAAVRRRRGASLLHGPLSLRRARRRASWRAHRGRHRARHVRGGLASSATSSARPIALSAARRPPPSRSAGRRERNDREVNLDTVTDALLHAPVQEEPVREMPRGTPRRTWIMHGEPQKRAASPGSSRRRPRPPSGSRSPRAAAGSGACA